MSDLHQRLLHQLDRVTALNTRPCQASPPDLPPRSHPSRGAEANAGQPNIPALNMPTEVDPQTASDDLHDRGEPRRQVSKKGLIVYQDNHLNVDCEINDLTATGAKLSLHEDITVPSCFELIILPENTSKRAQVCWRVDRQLGIQFIED